MSKKHQKLKRFAWMLCPTLAGLLCSGSLRLEPATPLPILSWSDASNRADTIWYTTNLLTSDWRVLNSGIDANTYTDTVQRAESALYYKITDVTGEMFTSGISIQQLVIPPPPTEGKLAPIADAGADIEKLDSGNGIVAVPLNVAAIDPDGGPIVAYNWYENTSRIATGATPTISFSRGTHDILVVVIDDEGAIGTDTLSVEIAALLPVLSWSDASNRAGTIWYTTNLLTSSWQVLNAGISTNMYIDTVQHMASTMYYKITDVTGEGLPSEISLQKLVLSPPPAAGKLDPIADAGADIEKLDSGDGTATVPLNVAATDPDGGSIVAYNWYENTSRIATGATPTISFSRGTHDIHVVVMDDEGTIGTDTLSVEIVAPQDPLLSVGANFDVRDVDGNGFANVQLTAAASDPDGGDIVRYEWTEGGLIATGATPVVSLAVGSHQIMATVTDDEGATATDLLAINVLPQVNPTPDRFEVWMADPEVRVSQKIYVQVGIPATRVELALDDLVATNRATTFGTEEIFELDYMALNLGAGEHVLTVTAYNESDQVLASSVRTWTQTRAAGEFPKVGIDKHNNILKNGVPFFPVASWLLSQEADSFNHGSYEEWGGEYINAVNGVPFNQRYFSEWTNTLRLCETYNLPMIGPAGGDYYPAPNNGNSPKYFVDGFTTYSTTLDTNKLVNYINAGKDRHALFAWTWKDEPDLGGKDSVFVPTEVRSWTELTHQQDPNHPVFINVIGYNYTYNGGIDNLKYQNRRGSAYTFLYGNTDLGSRTMPSGYDPTGKEKFLIADIISMDYYPYERGTYYSPDWVNVENCMLAFDRLQSWNYDLVPTVNWIETGDIYKDTHSRGFAPTPAISPHEFHNLIWLSVIHGAKGIQWFHYFGDPAIPNSDFPDNNKVIANQFLTDIAALTPVVLSDPNIHRVVTDTELGGGRIDIMTREHTDGTLYLFAGNIREESQTVRFDVEGLTAGQTIALYGSNRTLTAQDGFFEDTFNALDINIYQIPAAQ